MNFDMNISKSANSLFEVITSYHINYLYVNLYPIVNARVSKKEDISKADVYTGVLVEAAQNYCLQKGYRKNISNLHQYFCRHTKFNSISFKDFIDKIIKELIPEDFFDSLVAVERHRVVANVLKNSLKHFVSNIVNNNKILLFIDNRIDKDHIALLKNIYLSILINERQNIYKKFIAPGIDKNNTAEISAKIYELKKELDIVSKKITEKDQIIGLLKVKLEEMINAYKNIKSNNDYLMERVKLLQLQNKNFDIQNRNTDNIINQHSSSIQDINSKLHTKSSDEQSDKFSSISDPDGFECVRELDESDDLDDNIRMDNIINERLNDDNNDLINEEKELKPNNSTFEDDERSLSTIHDILDEM